MTADSSIEVISLPRGNRLQSMGIDDATGSVKFFNDDQGFGFITPENCRDVFVHVADLQGGAPLREGQIVSYEVGQDRKTGRSKAGKVHEV